MMYEKKGRYIVEFPDIPKARQHHVEIDVDARRGNYREVDLGFPEDRAVLEAKRCLSCRRCLGCALCWAECKPEAIRFEMEDEVFDLDADAVVVSAGVDRPVERLDRRFGFGTFLNVITDLQLERMLSRSGPSAGLVLRPYDGEIPRSVAFVQSYGSAAPAMHRRALCFGVNEAVLVRQKLADAEIRVYAADLSSFREEFAKDLEKLDGIEIHEIPVAKIEAMEDQCLRVFFEEDGQTREKTFELVVLLTQPQLSGELKDLSKSLGLSYAYADFLAGNGPGVIRTEKESIGLAAQA